MAPTFRHIPVLTHAEDDLLITNVIFDWRHVILMGLLPDTQNFLLRMRRECRERFPRHRLQRKPLASDPGMHHGTCVTHVPWCMSGTLTHGGGEDVDQQTALIKVAEVITWDIVAFLEMRYHSRQKNGACKVLIKTWDIVVFLEMRYYPRQKWRMQSAHQSS